MIFGKKSESLAQLTERLQSYSAIVVTLIGVAFGCDAFAVISAPATAELLQQANDIIMVAVMLGAALMFWMWVRLSPASRCKGEPEGFITDVSKKATLYAWTLTALLLIFWAPILDAAALDWPVAVVTELTVAASMLVYGAAFFLLSRESGDDADDFLSDEAPE